MQLEADKIFEITSSNKKLILDALEMINNISNDVNIKVAYIKILSNLLKFNKGIENYFYSNKELAHNEVINNDDSQQKFTEIKANLKAEFNKEIFSSDETVKFYSYIDNIENNIFEIFSTEEMYEFNNYLIQLINDHKIDEFIWLNTIYNIYKDKQSLRDIVNDYRTFNQIEFSDLYKMYLFVTDYNINNLLLMGESEFIKDDYLKNINIFFDYMYSLIDDMKTFVAKENKKDILSFDLKMESYTNVKTPDKNEFLTITKKIFGIMNDIFKNDNTKLLLDNVYPLVIKAFYAPLKNNDKIKYDFNPDFLFAMEYLQVIIEVMSSEDD
ncbi:MULTISPECIES: hypothetical protein [unclassified Gemella]|uniref:hypothetical protein n=1 Tax=unclassified Gemella TaxID=2624949 RepID=UPI001C54F6D5|nr:MULTISPECIES: hypothetical protein [unclassified Gemella]